MADRSAPDSSVPAPPPRPRKPSKAQLAKRAAIAQQAAYDASWIGWLESNPAVAVALVAAAGGLAFLLWRAAPWRSLRAAASAASADAKAKRKGQRKINTGAGAGDTSSSSSAAAASANADDNADAQTSPVTPVGFKNVGNTCFLNALLQALSSSGPFIVYLQQLQSLSALVSTLPSSDDSFSSSSRLRPSSGGAEFISSLLQLISPAAGGASGPPSSFFSSSASLNPSQFLSLLREQSTGKFRGFNQEDAHELWNVLQDLVERHASAAIGAWSQAVKREKNAARQRREAMDLESLMDGEAAGAQAATPTAAAAAASPTDSDSPSSSAAAAASAGEVLIPDGLSKKPAAHDARNGFDPPSDTDSEPSSELLSSSCTSELHSSVENSSIHGSNGANGHDANGAAAGLTPLAASADAASSMPSWATQSFAHGSSTSSSSIGAAFAARIAAQAALARSDPLSCPVDPFQGLRANFLVCKTCHTPSSSRVKTEPFNSLTLSFPYGDSAPTDLHSLLSLFVKTELVESVRCEKCNWSERHKLLREEYGRMLQESRGKKPGPKARHYQDLLSQLINEAVQAEMMLQPNAGQLVEQWARDQAQAQAQAGAGAVAATRKHAFGDEEEEKKQSMSASSSSSAASAAAASAVSASSLAPSDSFLSAAAPSSSADLLLCPSYSSASNPSLWSSLPSLVRDPEFAASIPSLHKSAALNFLTRLAALDTKRTFGKSTTLSRLPRMVCLHLNRLDGFSSKRAQHVDFPARLDLGRYTTAEKADALVTNLALSGDPDSANARKYHRHKIARGAGASGSASVLANPAGSVYQLDAVVVHLGGGSGGHYVAYRRQTQPPSSAAAGSSSSASSWYYISDEECRPVSFQSVLQAQAYLLIYSAID